MCAVRARLLRHNIRRMYMYKTAKDAEALRGRLKAEGADKPEIIRQLSALCLGWPYVYAAAGEMCTPEWRKNRMQYSSEKYAAAIRDACPVLSGSQKQIIGYADVVDDSGQSAYQAPAITISSCAGCKWDGCRCFDCRGFTRWLLEQAEITLAGGGATSQWDTASNWVAKGTIDTMPKGLVCCVFKRKDGKMSHTGMSMGDGGGGVIHCSTTVKRGNAYTDYSKWTHWGIPRGLYSNKELREAGIKVQDGDNLPTLRRGSKGEAVKRLQTLLNEQTSAGLNPDGIFGAKTESAVRHLQELRNLRDDGIVGPKTWAALGVNHFADVGKMIPDGANPPADVGADTIRPLPDASATDEVIAVPLADWQTIKAAVQAAYHIIKQYEG